MVPPDGWSQEVRPDGVMMLSPANERGDRAIYLMLRPQAADGELKPWLMQQTGEAAGLFGRLKDRKAVKWIKLDSYYPKNGSWSPLAASMGRRFNYWMWGCSSGRGHETWRRAEFSPLEPGSRRMREDR